MKIKKKKDKESDKKKKKAINAFVELLFSCKQIRSNSLWTDIRDLIKDDPAFHAIPSDEDRHALFQDFVTRKQDSDEEGRIHSESPKDRKKDKKHKKGSSSSSSSSSKKEKKQHKQHKDKKHHRASASDDDAASKRRKKDPTTSAATMTQRDSSPEEGEAR